MAMTSNGNPDITLYYHPQSFYSQKVIMYLLERKIPFRAKMVNINAGKQFSSDFLSMSPRGEVPVLVDQNTRTIPDSQKIIEYLEDNFNCGVPPLIPADVEFRGRFEELNKRINALNVEALSLGSCMYEPRELQIDPKKPYDSPKYRKQVQEFVKNRLTVLKAQIKNNPAYADALVQKLKDVENQMGWIFDKEKYTKLILQFESLLDECEADLKTQDDPTWLVAPHITVVDISLGILMHRLWELGYDQMWLKNREHLAAYYNNRICGRASFQKAISLSPESNFGDFFSSSLCIGTIGLIGLGAVAAGAYFVWKQKVLTGKSLVDILLGRKSVPSPHISKPTVQGAISSRPAAIGYR